jgi:hypothetical protein
MIGAVHHDGKPVARGIFGEIIVGDRPMLFEPVLQGELRKGSSEFLIDLVPGTPKFGC